MQHENRPDFVAGRNIAMKIPSQDYDAVVAFYCDVLGLPRIEDVEPDVCITYGAKRLWLDKVSNIKKTEIWLEICCDDTTLARDWLEMKGVTFRDDAEDLPPDLDGFWIAAPNNVIHLVCHHDSG